MVRRVLIILLSALVLNTFSQQNTFDTFPRGTISASYCYGFDNYNYTNLDVNYYVYYLTLAGYPISYMNVFGGVSYKFDQTMTDTELGYTVGLSLNFLFVTARPTYKNGYVLYRSYDSCYAYGGVNYPILWAQGGN